MGRWVSAWPYRIPTESRLLSFKMLWHTTKGWGRIGRRAERFGQIDPRTRMHCEQISCRWQPRGRGMWAAIRTSSSTILICEQTNSIFWINLARRRSRATSSMTIGAMWILIQSGRHGCATSNHACWLFGAGTICRLISVSRNGIGGTYRTQRSIFSTQDTSRFIPRETAALIAQFMKRRK